jgi:DNA polymerase III delta prime subunit
MCQWSRFTDIATSDILKTLIELCRLVKSQKSKQKLTMFHAISYFDIKQSLSTIYNYTNVAREIMIIY